MSLWAKYLQKLEIAFCQTDTHNINSKNIKWKRDRIFFELYHLDLKHSNENQEEEQENLNFKIEKKQDHDEDMKMAVDENEPKSDTDENNQESDPESEINEEDFNEDEWNNSTDLIKKNRKTIVIFLLDFLALKIFLDQIWYQ